MFSHFNHTLFAVRGDDHQAQPGSTVLSGDAVTKAISEEVAAMVSREDDNAATLVGLRMQTKQALRVFALRGEDGYRQECHGSLMGNLLRHAEMLKLHTLFSGVWDIADELYEIEKLLTNRLAWRREAFRQMPKYLWWRDAVCHALAQKEADGEPLPVDIAELLVAEARAIVTENQQPSLNPVPTVWLRYSIWWATPLEALMLNTLNAATKGADDHA